LALETDSDDDLGIESHTVPPGLNTDQFKNLAARIDSINTDARENVQEDDAVDPSQEQLTADSVDEEFVEVFFEEAREQLDGIQSNLVVWKNDPGDREAQVSIRRAFHTLKGSGRMVEQFAIAEFARCVERLLNAVLDDRLAASSEVVSMVERARVALLPVVAEGRSVDREAAESLTTLAAEVDLLLPDETEQPEVKSRQDAEAFTEPAPQEQESISTAAPSPNSTLSELDQEMWEVFLQEATEVLDAGESILNKWSADRSNQKLLNDLRRETHTLKGSARMTGLMALGDLAHAMESLLDSIVADASIASDAVLVLLQQTLDRLNDMILQVRDGYETTPAEDLINDLNEQASTQPASDEPLAAILGGSQSAPDSMVGDRYGDGQSTLVTGNQLSAVDQELLGVFLQEADELLNASDIVLQRWSSAPAGATDLLNDLQRMMHTLKGSARMTGLVEIGELAHAMESLLEALAKDRISPSAAVTDILQRSLDHLIGMVVEANRGASLAPAQSFIDELGALLGKPPAPAAAPGASEVRPTMVPGSEKSSSGAGPEETVRVSSSLLNNLVNQMGESIIYRARVDQGVGALRFNLAELEQTIARLRQQLRRLEIETEAQILFRYDEDLSDRKEDFDPLELDRFSELQQLSRSLMEVVDDLTNLQETLENQAHDMNALLDQQARVNKEVQQGLMRTRMVRFSGAASRLRRVVRQVALELNKRVELLLEGLEAEVDRTVLENMVAPLEHMLRNSIAHGIEPPSERMAAGKPEAGTISLTLVREGAELVITMRDDGAGINFDAVRAKGEAKGLLVAGQPVTEQELLALLLQPGFSTASQVTQVAGRGVGMDVLANAIKEMRGALHIESESGKGASFTIRLPFSLAVTQALLVEAGGEVFAVPLLSIEAAAMLAPGEMRAYLAGQAVDHTYNGHDYPLHSLSMALGYDRDTGLEATADSKPPVLLFRSAEASAALQVDAVLGNQEIIVKPVGPQVHAAPGISGATVLADGRVVVVLELASLVRHLLPQGQLLARARSRQDCRPKPKRDGLHAMVIDDSITMRKITARFLERQNIAVTAAKDGVEAVALLEQQSPDFVILDIEMPRMDGFEVVAHMRNHPRLKETPVIMVTSRSGEKHRERAFKLGVNDYLIKPYQQDGMMSAIRRLLVDRGLELKA
jgi:chemosensory pili system protein ChpA (sensor histidine kinase/response regulator)